VPGLARLQSLHRSERVIGIKALCNPASDQDATLVERPTLAPITHPSSSMPHLHTGSLLSESQEEPRALGAANATSSRTRPATRIRPPYLIYHYSRFTSGPASGQTMIVQATNTGGDLGHVCLLFFTLTLLTTSQNHFDLMMPGGGVGLFVSTTRLAPPPNLTAIQ
jgi:hypothetical protein